MWHTDLHDMDQVFHVDQKEASDWLCLVRILQILQELFMVV